MNKLTSLWLFYLLLFAVTAPSFALENDKAIDRNLTVFATKMKSATQQKEPLPHLSQFFENPTRQLAINAQRRLVKQLQDDEFIIAGFKAGLTSKAGQKKFKVTQPISGVLFKQFSIDNPKNIRLKDFRKLMLETEIGYRLSRDITRPITQVSQLKTAVSSIMPVIEMPDLAFAHLSAITGEDIIASNAIANRYLLGKAISHFDDIELNSVKVKLTLQTTKQSNVVNKGTGQDAMGNQWKALMWLINERLQAGFSLKKGQFLITGALGKMVPASSGKYQADFGPLGNIEFTIEE